MITQVLCCTLALLWLVPITAAAGGDPAHGQALFLKYCSGCHGTDGRGGAHTFMPHVNTLTKKGYIESVPDDFLLLVISKGGAAVGKSGFMPAWESTLDRQDILDIIAHIRSLPTY